MRSVAKISMRRYLSGLIPSKVRQNTGPDIFPKSGRIPDRTFFRNPARNRTGNFPKRGQKPDRIFFRKLAGYRTGHFSEIRSDTGPDLLSGAPLIIVKK